MAARVLLSTLALFVAMASFVAYATDPNQMQDFCVGTNDPSNSLFVNGFFCKDPSTVTVDDFVFTGFNIPNNTTNIDGTNNTLVTASTLPGLNTLGISLIRLDFAPDGGMTPPHIHHRATEVLTVLEGTLLAGFVTSNNYKLYSKVLSAGDIFVVPQGLAHFQYNIGKTNAVAIGSFSAQDPGNTRIENALFASEPRIKADIIAKALQLDEKIVEELQAKTYLTGND